jgi:hypothetical protein
VGGLVSRSGCFLAGETAAESEGIYTITARADGRSAEGTVTVAFPDLGDLLRARLDPSKEFDGDPVPADASASQPAPPQAAAQPPATSAQPLIAPGGRTNTTILIVAISTALLLAVAALAVVLLVRRGRARREPDEDWDDDDQDPPASRPLARDLGPTSKPAPPPPPKMFCPRCGELFPPGAKFCPHDAIELVTSDGNSKNAVEDKGMVCPKCHRGYDPGAKYCPHDAEKLVPYPTWRSGRRGG